MTGAPSARHSVVRAASVGPVCGLCARPGPLCAVGRELGVPEAGLRNAIHLGQEATVSKVKALSRSGDLARARVLHFATHGLLAGETAIFAKNKAEPALVLTPPTKASKEDNGLLTASEVAQLQLNADWVVLSACNTAGGSAEGAEALSGLAALFLRRRAALCSSRIGR